jgi:DNA-directed RNA polymerase-3 subunit RPC5
MDIDDESEDTVVREIDVFISQKLKDELCILQYPLKPSWRPSPNTDMKLSSAKMKLNQFKLQLDYATKDNDHFDENMQFANECEIERLTSKKIPFKTNYGVAVFRDGKLNYRLITNVIIIEQLHITPLQHLLQLRPSFHYIGKFIELLNDVPFFNL